MELVLFVLIWLGWSLLNAALAHRRGRSGINWFIASVLLSPVLVTVILLAMKPGLTREQALDAMRRHAENEQWLRAHPEVERALYRERGEPTPEQARKRARIARWLVLAVVVVGVIILVVTT